MTAMTSPNDLDQILGRTDVDPHGFAADCADDGVRRLFICEPPMLNTGATGSPMNPNAFE